jgi:hypothetical protein
MDVRVPPKVAQTARDLALGELIGRYPQAADRIIRVLCWVYAAPFIVLGTLGLIPHAPGFGPFGVRWFSAVLVLCLAAPFVCLALLVKRHRALFLYREGIIAVTTWGRIRLSARWEDVQMISYSVRTYINGGFAGTNYRYELSVLGKIKLRYGAWRPDGLGPLMMATAAVAKTSWALERLRSGKKVYLGSLAAEPRGVVFHDRAFGNDTVVPWDRLTLSNEAGSWRLGTSDHRTTTRLLGSNTDNAVLLNLISAVKTDPSTLTPAS